MRSGRTHDILTSYAMPTTKKKIIRKVNREIDNPTPYYKQFKKTMGFQNNQMFQIPGMKMYPHRKRAGHDFSDGIYFAAKYGQTGFEAWMNHQAQDIISDFMVKHYGSFTRNIVEDAIQEFSRPKYRKNSFY